jgi:hypothetical protein
MPNPQDKLSLLTQDELFSVLRSMLKTTNNDSLENLLQLERVQALFCRIQTSTWKEACENHFNLAVDTLTEADPKNAYLQAYPKNRFGA